MNDCLHIRALWLVSVLMLCGVSVHARSMVESVIFSEDESSDAIFTTDILWDVSGNRDDDGGAIHAVSEAGQQPVVLDQDGDGLTDEEEAMLGLDPVLRDTDGDGLTDGTEIAVGLDALAYSTSENGVGDGDLDSDEDGWSNRQEQDARSNLIDPDSYPGLGGTRKHWADGSASWRVIRK